jgi:GT2 family glycosyltransferase
VKESTFIIGIPTLNRADLLIPTLLKYEKDFPNTAILVLDNGNQNLTTKEDFPTFSKNIFVQNPRCNLGVARSWNRICKFGFGICDNVLLVNDDVYLGYGEKTVHEAISLNKSGVMQSEHLWSVVLINKTMYETIGEFDEQFYPAYCEDSDYMYRMKLLGIRHDINPILNPKVVRHGMTREMAPEAVDESMRINRIKYANKWGGLPLLETYTTPYNK